LNTFLAVAIAWLIPFLGVGAFFGFSPLPWNILSVIAGLVVVYLLLVEVVKRFFYRRLHRGV
jgi:Mg2+-importing ATPase